MILHWAGLKKYVLVVRKVRKSRISHPERHTAASLDTSSNNNNSCTLYYGTVCSFFLIYRL